MSTNTGWRHAYQGAIGKVIVAKGEPVSPEDSYYGWVDYDLLWHLKGRGGHGGRFPNTGKPCDIVVTNTEVHEAWVDEFAGTDASGDHYSVAELRHCRCACGAAKDFTMRYKGSLADVLSAIEILDNVAPDAVVPADEVDARVSIVTQGIHRRLTSLQNDIQKLADTYALKAADPQTPQPDAVLLALIAADLLYALQQSERP